MQRANRNQTVNPAPQPKRSSASPPEPNEPVRRPNEEATRKTNRRRLVRRPNEAATRETNRRRLVQKLEEAKENQKLITELCTGDPTTAQKSAIEIAKNYPIKYNTIITPDVLSLIESEETLGVVLDILKINFTERQAGLLTNEHFSAFTKALDEVPPQINGCCTSGLTPLTSAIKCRSIDRVVFLIENGADINLRDAAGHTPITQAMLCRRPAIVDLLAERGVEIARDKITGPAIKRYSVILPPMFWSGIEKIADLIEDPQACKEKINACATFVINLASEKSIFIQIFLSLGLDPNLHNHRNCTLLMEAARSGQTSCLKSLLDRGADVNAKQSIGMTALIFAASKGSTECVKLLLEHGADIDRKAADGVSALQIAIGEQHDECAALLRNAGAKEDETFA